MGQVARDLGIQRRERLLQNCLTALSVIKKKDILVSRREMRRMFLML